MLLSTASDGLQWLQYGALSGREDAEQSNDLIAKDPHLECQLHREISLQIHVARLAPLNVGYVRGHAV
jgi:hypothetical protein